MALTTMVSNDNIVELFVSDDKKGYVIKQSFAEKEDPIIFSCFNIELAQKYARILQGSEEKFLN